MASSNRTSGSQKLSPALAWLVLMMGAIATPLLPATAQDVRTIPGTPSTQPLPTTPVSTPPTTPRPAAVPVAPELPYTLGPGDRVKVDIFRVEQYSGEFEVLIDGSITLPLVGKLDVNGMTVEQATQTISRAFSRYLRRPLITLSVTNRRPLQVAIAGEVNRPGSYSLALSNGGQVPTLSQVVQSAGGVTRSADVRRVQIRRPQRGSAPQVINVDLWNLIQTGNQSSDLRLRDGDSIFIPETAVALTEAPILAASNLSPEDVPPVNVAVVGEVFRPGPQTVSGAVATTNEAGQVGRSGGGGLPTVTRAIQVAGGIRPRADIRQIQIRRPTRTGSTQTFNIDLWKLLEEGDLSQDAILQEGDTILIPTATTLTAEEVSRRSLSTLSPESIRINVVGEVEKNGEIRIAPNTPLNQAILAAGGFNNRARRSSVDLIRLNPDGTVVRRRIEVDFAQGTNEQNNPALENNDVIVVRRSGLASTTDTLDSILTPFRGLFSIFDLPFRFLRLFN